MRMMVVAILLAGPALAQGTPAAKPTPAADKLICHREEVTGSLAGGHKTCLTRAQWEEQARAAQAIAGRMVDAGNIQRCAGAAGGGC